MKSSIYFIIILSFACCFSLQAQTIRGIVLEKNTRGETPLIGANVIWMGTTLGVATNDLGEFQIRRVPGFSQLLISYIGYEPDTLQIDNQDFVKIYLRPALELEAVIIEDKALNREVNQSELITTKGLRKAACCNLSESFETQGSVDVSSNDALTGTKRIRLLGLDGLYAQIMTENIPTVRGLAARSGLQFIPGTWMKSIDINKGAGSVVNGYESFTGQINVELAKPEISEKILLNGYINANARTELNLNTSHKISEKWHSGLLLHGSTMQSTVDQNDDGFQDVPRFTQLNLLNRWKYQGENFESQIGFRVLWDDRLSGQTDFKKGMERTSQEPYGFNVDTKRLEAFAKLGFTSPKNPLTGIGLIFSGLHHNQDSYWGLTDYEATHNNFSFNGIFQTEFSPNHKLRAGLSFVGEEFQEEYTQGVEKELDRQRTELVPGIFAEYFWAFHPKFSIIAGLRTDFHNLYGAFASPRVHFKYEISENTLLRLSGGKGFRVSNPIVENIGYLISSRSLSIASDLKPEIAWNYGGSLSQQFRIGKRKASLVLDFYRTDFVNQAVIDLDSSPNALNIGNLDGKAYANSLQMSASYEIIERFDINLAYKYYDVKTTIGGELITVPFVPEHRFFINLAYATYFDKWTFDFTTQWVGSQRIPSTEANPAEFRRPQQSPAFFTLNAQITKRYKKWEIYVGGENLGNFRQSNPIIDPQNPFGENFDAGLVYAPIQGWMLYTGFRFTVK